MKPCILLDGAFDPLHAGHIHYIRSAKLAFPDYEIMVSVCSDEQIRAKGREPLLSQNARLSIVGALRDVDHVWAKLEPTEQTIAAIKPAAYVKGKDWEGKLPDEQLAACSLYGVQIVFLNTVLDSSSDALRRWALADAERGLSRLETFMAGQQPVTTPWRPVTDYSFEARKAIEGPHAELIWRWLSPYGDSDILDYGCGPDGHLVRMLNEAPNRDTYASVLGYDPQAADLPGLSRECPTRDGFFDLVICREVLEHLTVREVCIAVANLFRLSSKFVYITTRFSDRGVFDAATDFETDPTHITCLSQPFLRSLCVLNGGKRRADLETRLDWQHKGRVLVYEV